MSPTEHGPVDLVVVGAGAAGLWAAAVASERGLQVILLEKTPRCGTKILASGGTRCNLTTTLEAQEAGLLFGQKGARFLRAGLSVLSPQDVREHFHALGVMTEEAPLEKIFPASHRAKDVRDALEEKARSAGVTIHLEHPVLSLEAVSEAGRYRIRSGEDGETYWRTHNVFLASGGASVPKSGTTGDGYHWLRQFDLPVVPPAPALVPLTSPADWVHDLAGIAVENGNIRLKSPSGKRIAERMRPILFTHRGLSGPGAMDLSEAVARAQLGEAQPGLFEISIDLLPAESFDSLRDLLVEAQGRPARPSLGAVLPEVLPRRLLQAVARQAEVADTITKRGALAALTKSDRHRLIEALKDLRIPIDGTLGMDKAEVTSGGLDLRAVNPRTMEVNGHPGLFVFGELLDIAGPIGGLNFQAAWATAELAGRSVQAPTA